MKNLLWTEPSEPASATHAHYVQVAVERSIEKAARGADARIERGDQWQSGVLTYGCAEALRPGVRVEVPLGRGRGAKGDGGAGGQTTEGMVVDAGGLELLGGLDPARVRSVLRVLPTGSVPASVIELAKWMAGYYVCPIGMVLASMVPSAVKRSTGTRTVSMIARGSAFALDRVEVKLPASVQAMWELARAIEPDAWPLTPDRLLLRTKQKTRRAMNVLIKADVLTTVGVDEVHARGGAPLGEAVEAAEVDALDPAAGGESAATLATGTSASRPSLTPQQATVVDGLTGAIGAFGVHLIRGVTGSGKTEVYLRAIEHLLTAHPTSTALVLVPEISLTPQMGGRVQSRLGHFGVAVLHSGLSASQRHKQWQRAAIGAAGGSAGARVVIGARSAIFAPLSNVGIIVVDEEHASDYKQDQLPRYHGRDVAIKRAQIEKCPIVLGSATPSLESWANAVGLAGLSEPGKYRLWELTERVGGARLPKVEIVDLATERKALDQRRRLHARTAPFDSSKTSDLPSPHSLPPGGGFQQQAKPSHRPSMLELGEMIGPTLERALAETLTSGGQAVLLLNRRGYSGYIACADTQCGWVLRCDDCDAGMVLHKHAAGVIVEPSARGGVQTTLASARREHVRHSPRVVRCHHCLAQQLLPTHCPSCSKGLVWLGLGTQRVEEEISEKFASCVRSGVPGSSASATPDWVVRVDGDTMNSARDYFDVLGRFAKGSIRVLVGTQMIAKGLDFPNVRLVGVINADTALGLPDFRATERTFQLVSQVAGRAGRAADAPGRVIVQTFEPDSPAIRFAAEHDFVGFATEELSVRVQAGLPPATRMARIVVRDEVFERAMKGAARIGDELRRAAGEASLREGGVRTVGPMECPINRIAGQYRVAIELLALRRGSLQNVLAMVRSRGELKSDAHTAVDIDPIALL